MNQEIAGLILNCRHYCKMARVPRKKWRPYASRVFREKLRDKYSIDSFIVTYEELERAERVNRRNDGKT